MVWSSTVIKKLAFFLILIGIAVAGIAQDDNQKLRLLIHEFSLDTNESKVNIKLGISKELASSFVRYGDIEILDLANYPDLKLENLQKRIEPDSLPGVDMVVFGSYVVVNNYVKITPVIFDFEESLFHPLSHSRGTLEGIEVFIDEVADNLYESFVEISPKLQGTFKRVAIINDFETVSGVYKNIGNIRKKSQEYTKEVISELDYRAPANVEVLSWGEVYKYSSLTSAEIINKLKPDMYLKLMYVFDGEVLHGLKTEFYLLEKSRIQIQKREFTLPDLKADYYENIEFQEFVINELFAFFEQIINDRGQWDYKAFPNKSRTSPAKADALIRKAENNAQSNDFYLSNYYYYEALNNFPDQIDVAAIRLQIGFNKIYTYRLEEAQEEFDFVLGSDPENGYAYIGKSLISYYEGDYSNANNFLNTAEEKGLDDKFLIDAQRAYYFYELQNYGEALNNFEKALSAKQKIIKIRIVNKLSVVAIKTHMGLCYLGLEQYDKSIDLYNDLKKEFPYDNDIPYYLANSYSKRGIDRFFNGEYNLAIQDFQESRKNYPNRNINEFLRYSFVKEGRYEGANAFIESEIKAGNYEPEFVWETHAIDIRSDFLEKASQNAGVFDENIGNELIASMQKSLKFKRDNADALYYIGETYTVLGVVDSGYVYMLKASEADPFNFDAQLGTLQAYLIAEQYNDFNKYYRSASRANKKQTLDSRTSTLMNFFYVSASLAQDKKAKKEIKDLNKLLQTEVVIAQWVLKPYENWLQNCQCSEGAKSTLNKYLGQLKEHIQQ